MWHLLKRIGNNQPPLRAYPGYGIAEYTVCWTRGALGWPGVRRILKVVRTNPPKYLPSLRFSTDLW